MGAWNENAPPLDVQECLRVTVLRRGQSPCGEVLIWSDGNAQIGDEPVTVEEAEAALRSDAKGQMLLFLEAG